MLIATVSVKLTLNAHVQTVLILCLALNQLWKMTSYDNYKMASL